MSTPDKVMTPCPSCGAKLAVPSTAAGKKIRCPKCQTVVAITADMVTPPPEVAAPPVPVPQSAQRPEVSLGGENTFAGGKQKKYAPESLGDQATFGGGRGPADDPFTDDMEIVDLAGRYKVEGVLGKGGMGEVQLATDTRLNRKVAIKRMLGDAAKSRTAVSRFLIEAKSIAALNHPNIVQIYDYGRDKDGPFLILEYVDGNSLLDKCHNGALTLELAVDLTCQLCDGLGKAHESGIIHRDIKPANVLMTKDGVPKLTDFGLAKDEASDSGLSVAGAVLGTLDFMPPEQRKDVALTDSRSDLWSLAATLYQMVTGKSPKVIRLNDLPASLQSVLGKALEDKPNDRYQSAAEFRNALRQVMDESRATLTDLAEGQCPSCGTKNEASRKFCRKCAVSLEVKCLSCSKGMPVWDEICGRCGTKQSSLIVKRKERLQQRQHQAEDFLRQGKFPEASELTEKLAAEVDPRFLYIKKWSVEFTERLGQEQRLQQQRSGVLHEEAKTHKAAHDYSSAIHTLEQIPASLRTPEISALLMQVQGQEERTKELNEEIRLRVERRELDGLIIRVDELLQLVPDRVDLRDLRDTLEKRDQQRLAARSSASLEANRLMDARKYAECVAVLQSIKGSLRTPEIDALQQDAAAKLSRLEKLQQTIDQAVKNNHLNGLLANVDELLLLKSEVREEDEQLRKRLVAREQKQMSQIQSVLRKVEELRNEGQFDKALEMLERIPPSVRTDTITAAIQEILILQERVNVLARLAAEGDEEYTQKQLSNAEDYHRLLVSAGIKDLELESAIQGCRDRLEELSETVRLAPLRHQRKKRLKFFGGIACVLLIMVSVAVVIPRQQRLKKIADAQTRGDAALQAASYTAAILAFDEVIDLDNKIGDAWLGRALAKFRQTPPDVAGGWRDLENGEALNSFGKLARTARQLGHVTRAIERANSNAIPESLLDLAEAEKRSVPIDQILVIKSAVVSAYFKQVDIALAAQRPEAALQLLEGIRSIEPLHPRLPELQANAFVIRAQQLLDAGKQKEANAEFVKARNLSTVAVGLGPLAVALAESFVRQCEEHLSETVVEDAKSALQRVAEIDPSSGNLRTLNARLASSIIIRPYVERFTTQVAAKDLVACVATLKELLELPDINDDKRRITVNSFVTAIIPLYVERFTTQVAAKDLLACVTTLKELLELPDINNDKQRVAVSSFVTAIEPLCLSGLQSKSPAAAIDALRLLTQTNVTFGESFKSQMLTLPPDVIQALPDGFLLPATSPFDVAQAKVYQTGWAARFDLPVEMTNSIGIKFVLIPPGEFIMGSPVSDEGRDLDETQHKVVLTKPFYIGMGEVTQEQGLRVVGTNPSGFKGMQNPVERVSWEEAVAYCNLLSALPAEQAAGRIYRLPTEAEWEYACRGGTETAYNFGESASVLRDYAWYDDNSGNTTHVVGQGPANSFGLYDMHGNVWEWCSDSYGAYPDGAVTDPVGPGKGSDHVIRGGSWSSVAANCRSANRGMGVPTYRNDNLGFRLALSPSVQQPEAEQGKEVEP